MKWQSLKWEKILANHVSDKKLISNYIRNSHNSKANKENKFKNKLKSKKAKYVFCCFLIGNRVEGNMGRNNIKEANLLSYKYV